MISSLVSIKRIQTVATATEQTGIIAEAILTVGHNVIPLYIENVGTEIDPQYELIQKTPEQLETLAALRIAKSLKPTFCNASCVVVNRMSNHTPGQIDNPKESVLAQLGAGKGETPKAKEPDMLDMIAQEAQENTEKWKAAIATMSLSDKESMITRLVATKNYKALEVIDSLRK